MRKWKRYAGLALAGMMALSAGGVAPLASPDTEGDAAGSGTVQTETVEIGSDVWETPVIPDAPVSVAGVSETEISLNDTAGNGTWKFLFDIPDYTLENGVPYPTEENQDFDFTAWEDKNWQNIIVPGEPLMQGFDVLTNNEYYYQREITIPEDFAGNRVLVRFDGVYSNARVWINGKHIRTHVGGFTTWDCDITEYAAPGETVTMTVGVAELYSTTKGIWNPEGKSVNNPANATEYAHHDMTGILRDVSLVAMPYDYIARTYVNTDFDENFVNADLEVTAQLGLVSGDATLKIELVDGDTVVTSAETDFQRKSGEGLDVKNLPELVEEATGLLDENADNLYDSLDTAENGQYSREKYEAMETERDEAQAVLDSVPEEYLTRNSELTDAVKITIPVTAPKQWDAEHPNLYTLRTTLAVDGETVQVNEEKIGFREIQYNGADGTDHNKVYVNGKEVKLRGTCRHDVSDDLGRSMTREEAYAEAQAYKNANINFIRTSHYPASENLLDACDELGIYVEQETAVCFQGPWADVASKYEDFLPQFTEIIERDRNRACILIWSLGNESNYNKVASQSGGNAIQDEKDYLSDVDTSRPCIFSFPDTGEPADLADIYSVHYASVSGGLGSSTDGKPVLHDEFAHIPCYDLDELQRDANTRNFWGESIKIGWENIFETDGALGAALWGGIDDVFYIPEGTTERWQSHSDGQTAGYGEWGSVLDAYLREKPEAYLTKKAYSPVRVDEENCYVSAGTLYIPVKNWFDHTDLNEVELVVTTDAGEQRFQIAESIAPHSEGVITAAANIAADAQTVNLKFYTADGVMVDEYNVELAKVEYSFAPASETPPTIAENDDTITINGEGFALVFSKTTGLITSGTFDGKDGALLTGGPYLHVTGATLGEWTPAEENGITAEIQDNKYAVVTLNGSYANGQGVQFVMTISGNGIIKTDYTLTTAPATTTGLSEVGISYDIPSDMESVSWLRDGLYSAYPEDHIGRNKGTALKEREGSDENPDKYGVEPEWSWKDDMMNYFIWATDDPNNGLATNDFRTMRENVYYYNVNYGSAETSPRISVESENADVAARVSLTYDMGYIDDRDTRIDYQGSWAHYDSGSDYAGTETYSSVAGDSCTLTFEGTGVVFIGSKQNNTGKLKVYIDGEFKEEIDTYSNLGSALKQSEIYRIEGLENKEHTITIETCEGEYSCVVVDAFNVITPEGSGETEVSQLVINNQWYYPNLSWGNYTGQTGTMSQGMTGSATIRLTNGTNFTQEVVPSVTNLKVTDNGDKTLTASYDLRNGDENTEVSLQWYRIPVGDPASKAAAIDGAAEATLNVDGLEANGIYCVVTVLAGDRQVGTAQSNTVAVGMDYYQYYDILSDSPEFTFTGEAGTDYKTDLDMSWTANAYGKSVTYLLDSEEANNASVTFTFTGNGIRWVGGKENNQGIASVQIDDEPVVEVDLYGTATTGTQINEILFEKLWDEVGTHTITITRTGEKNENATAANVSLDAFIVINKETGRVIVDNLTVSQTAEGVLQADCEIRNGTEADVQFQWYAKDAYSAEGYARGEFTAVDGATGSTYTPAAEDAGKLFCCRATAGGATTESSALLVNAAMVDDTDESINYPADIIQDTTSKSYLTASDPYNDTVTYFRGGDLSFTFNGTGIVWIAGHDQAATNAMVSIDGNEAQSVNIPASDDGGWQFNQYEVFRVSDLEPGEHTIAIAAPGTEEKHSNLDAFMILNPGTASEEVSVQADGASGVQNLLMAPKLAPVVAGTAPTQEQIDAVIEELELAIEEFKASLYGRVPVESITLDTTELKLETGQTAKLNASVQPDNATDQTVVFSSSDETVVTVDAEGNVKAVGAGTAVITVTAENGSVTATCSVTVEDGGITPTPEPSETPEPEPSDTPEPTDEPNPSDTPEPTDEPNPSDTPDPTGTPGTGNKPGSGTGMGTGGGNTAGSGSGGTTSSGSGAQTGDNTPVLALGVAAALGAAGAVGLSVYRRRRKA